MRRPPKDSNLIVPPIVSGKWPLIGHGPQFSRDPEKFIMDCHQKYGDVFSIYLGRRKTTICANNALIKPIYRLHEHDLTFFEAFNMIGLDLCFSKQKELFPEAMRALRGFVLTDSKKILPKLADSCETFKERIQGHLDEPNHIYQQLKFYTVDVLLSYTLNHRCTEEIIKRLFEFSDLARRFVFSGYVLPVRLVFAWYGPRMLKLRDELLSIFTQFIEEEQETKSVKHLSSFKKTTDENFTTTEMATVVLISAFIQIANVATSISNALTFLPANPNWLETFRKACQEDRSKLLSSPMVNACVLEVMRKSTHFFTVSRMPAGQKNAGPYDLSEGSFVLSGYLMMNSPCSEQFADYDNFNPGRYLDEPKLCQPHNHIQWGGGIHTCPGRLVSQYEMKYILAEIFEEYNVILPEVLPKMDFTNISATARKPFVGKFSPRN